MSPKCKAWCKWNQFNMTKSAATAKKVMQAREDDEVHLLLCDALFQHQMSQGPTHHFHLEQPVGSEMLYQEILQDIMLGTVVTRCDQCVAGLLKHPVSQLPIQKGTQVVTTSTILAHYIGSFRCPHTHQHAPVAGSFSKSDHRTQPLSQFTELYTRTFATKLIRAMRASQQIRESSTAHKCLHEVFTGTDDALEDDPNRVKRRRLNGKQTEFPPGQSEPERPTTLENSRSDVLQQALEVAPRVGKLILENGPLFEKIQKLCPHHHIRVIEICKGTDRYRKPPIHLPKGEAPLRYTFGLHRHSLEPTGVSDWIQWEKMSNRQLCSKSDPHRILISVFARAMEIPHTVENESSSSARKRPMMESTDETNKQHQPRPRPSDAIDSSDPPDADTIALPDQTSTDQVETNIHTKQTLIPTQPTSTTHGPLFKALNREEQQWLSKIHHNLGHPSVAKLKEVLKQQGIDDRIIRGLQDFCCDTCHELQQPKIARPAHLPEPREFNDCVGCDLVTWTNKKGQNHQFMHFIDMATSFQLALPVFRTDAESLFQTLQDGWTVWAGPCRQLIIDNESALCSDQFAQLSQGQNMHLRVVAAYAHWQLGKTERHGDILQHMLQKIDHDMSIENIRKRLPVSRCFETMLQCQKLLVESKRIHPRDPCSW